MRMGTRIVRGVRRVLLVLPAVSFAACTVLPTPTPPAPLTKSQAAAVAKCQKSAQKAQLAFLKTQQGNLGSCVYGVLSLRLAFENSLATQEDFDAGLVKMRDKCTKGYAKITAGSTKLVDAIVKGCAPADAAVVGPYDALRFQAFFAGITMSAPANSEQVAGGICALAVDAIYANVGTAAPRLMELLTYLGPEYVSLVDADSGFPNVPLDPRCAPAGPPI